jgi:hypothetical protein
MAEDYVRPPLVGAEPRSKTAAVWRFRLVLLLLLAAVAVGLFFLIRHLVSGPGEGSPGVGLHAASVLTSRRS